MKDMIGYCGLDCVKMRRIHSDRHDDFRFAEKRSKARAELNNAPSILPEAY